MAKRSRRTIPLEQRPIGECTLHEITEHLQGRDQVIFVFAAHEVAEGVQIAHVDDCAWSGHVFELIRGLIEKAKVHRAKESGQDPDEDDLH